MENQRRKEWLESMLRIVSPVFDALEKEELHKTMPLDFHEERSEYAPLEAFGRSMLAPWLEAEGLEEEEEKLQAVWRKKALRCLDAATDPESADFMNFTTGGQPLVDTAFLCHTLVRAPKQLAGSLTEMIPFLSKKQLFPIAVIPSASSTCFKFVRKRVMTPSCISIIRQISAAMARTASGASEPGAMAATALAI